MAVGLSLCRFVQKVAQSIKQSERSCSKICRDFRRPGMLKARLLRLAKLRSTVGRLG